MVTGEKKMVWINDAVLSPTGKSPMQPETYKNMPVGI
jgi:hypothetical protein